VGKIAKKQSGGVLIRHSKMHSYRRFCPLGVVWFREITVEKILLIFLSTKSYIDSIAVTIHRMDELLHYVIAS